MSGSTRKAVARWLLRGLVVTLLVPGLLLAQTRVADADVYGPAVQNTIKIGSLTGGVTCNNTVRWHTTDTGTFPSIKVTSSCKTYGAVIGGLDSGSELDVTFSGAGDIVGPAPAGSCYGSSDGGNYAGSVPVSGSPFSVNLEVPATTGCNITKMCMYVHAVHNNLPDESFGTDCASIGLGSLPPIQPPTPDGVCTAFSVTPVRAGSRIPSNFGGVGSRPDLVDLYVHEKITSKVAQDDSAKLAIYVVIALANGTYDTSFFWGDTGFAGGIGAVLDADWWPEGMALGFSNTGAIYKTTDAWNSNGGPRKVVGMGVVWSPMSTVWANKTARPQDATGGLVGVNDPGNCQFYWGQKVASISGSDTDEPAGPLPVEATPPPTDDPGTPADVGDDGCGFSFTDPSTWAGGGMCELVGAIGGMVSVLKNMLAKLGEILNAIGGLAGNIASAITGALSGILADLFVPTSPPSFTDIAVNVPPGWSPSLPDLGDGSCGKVTMPQLDLGYAEPIKPDRGHVAAHELFDTCDSPWPLVRTFTYNGALALVLVSVVRLAFRALMTALGMAVESKAAGDED